MSRKLRREIDDESNSARLKSNSSSRVITRDYDPFAYPTDNSLTLQDVDCSRSK
jgi:hypothetical protein